MSHPSVETPPPLRSLIQFKIHGLDCAEEVATLKHALGPLVGGADRLSFDILNGWMSVNLVSPEASLAAVVEAVRKTGMRADAWRDTSAERLEPGAWERHGRTLMTTASGLLLVTGFVTHAALSGGIAAAIGSEGLGLAHRVPLAPRLIYLLSIVAGAWFVVPKAWYAARRLRPDMNLLMTVAIVGAVALGEWFEAGTVAFLFALSLTLESWSIGRARRAVAALMALAPPMARIVTAAGATSDVHPDEVAIGSRLLIRPGEKVPLDGIVQGGTSDVNQAPITGESMPVRKGPGSRVFAGTINGDGALESESTKAARDTTLARIVRMVAEAQSRRAPSEQWVERFARIYTPAVFASAVAVMLVPPLTMGAPWTPWVYRSLVLLVIGCPCALVISTPSRLLRRWRQRLDMASWSREASSSKRPAGWRRSSSTRPVP